MDFEVITRRRHENPFALHTPAKQTKLFRIESLFFLASLPQCTADSGCAELLQELI
jgi:hypothetical protein